MPLHQNGAKSLSEMPLFTPRRFDGKKVRINPKIPEHLSKSDLDFFFYLINDCAGRMLEEKEQLSVQKLELTFYSVTVLDVVSEESL